jgi:predicted SAM-dependent methyltransferase
MSAGTIGKGFGVADNVTRILMLALTRLIPDRVLREVALELRIAGKRVRYSRAIRRRLMRLAECRVNVGCGNRPVPGWVNLDVQPSSAVDFWDCRRGFPFSDNSVAAIYCEHVLEHFELASETPQFLRDAWRCLRPAGVIRIVVPDAGAYLRAYGGDWASLAAMRGLEPTEQGWRDPWIGETYQTQLQLINSVFRQRNEHRYAYDEETLTLVLHEAGFSRVIPQSFAVSIDREMAPDTEVRRAESLYVEAVK